MQPNMGIFGALGQAGTRASPFAPFQRRILRDNEPLAGDAPAALPSIHEISHSPDAPGSRRDGGPDSGRRAVLSAAAAARRRYRARRSTAAAISAAIPAIAAVPATKLAAISATLSAATRWRRSIGAAAATARYEPAFSAVRRRPGLAATRPTA